MPAYVYRCKSCEFTYEKKKKFSDAHDTECPECGRDVRRVINSVGIVFKGSGFYVNDSRSNNSAAPSSNDNNGGDKTETKSEDSSAAKKESTASKIKPDKVEKKSESKAAEKTPA